MNIQHRVDLKVVKHTNASYKDYMASVPLTFI